MPNGNLGVHLSPFSVPLLVVLASRKGTRSAFWCCNESVSRAWIKLFCSNNALRQCRRGNMSQLGVDCLNLVQHLQEKKGTAKAHFGTSSFTIRQSTLHLLACTATVRLPSNLSLLSLRRTGRKDTTCPITARAFKHRLHDSLVGCSATSTERHLEMEIGCGHNEPLEPWMTMVELGSGPRHEVITQRRALPRYCAHAPLHCSTALVFSDWTDPRSCIVCLNAFTASASATMDCTPSVFKIIACPSRSLHCTTLLAVHSSPFVFDVNSKARHGFLVPDSRDK